MKQAAQRYGPVTGIIHASGVLRDKKIQDKTLEDFGMVYNTKVVGLKNLLASVPRASLKHLVVFSSLAGFHGNVAQSDYAMANEVLNKSAHILSHNNPQLHVHAFDFGPWDGGMVSPRLKAHFKSQGVQIIPYKGGAQLVAEIIATPTKQIQCLVGNWGLPPSKPKNSTSVIRRRITAGANPFLSSHMIKGKKVIPMTVACGNMAQQASQLYPGYRLAEIKDCTLYGGLTLEGSYVDTQLEVSEVSNGKNVLLNCSLKQITSSGKAKPAYKASVVLTPARDAESAKISDFSAAQGAQASTYDGVALFHGPDFQGIDNVLNFDNSRMTLECHRLDLSSEAKGQFDSAAGFDCDLIMQAMLVWVRAVQGQASLPSKADKFEFLQPLPPKSTCSRSSVRWEAWRKTWVATYYTHDADGNVFGRGQVAVTAHDSLSF